MKPLSLSQRSSLEKACRIFEAAMPGSPSAEYVVGKRAISPQVGADFRLGHVPEGVVGFERFAGRLAVPNICASGHVVGFKFRSLDDGVSPKYDKPAGMPNRLFNLRTLNIASDTICITEGELDAVSVAQLGLPAVGIQGVKSWKRHHPALFEGYDRIAVIRDMDEAGLDLAKRLAECDLPVVIVEPPAKDCNEALVLGLGEELKRRIEGE